MRTIKIDKLDTSNVALYNLFARRNEEILLVVNNTKGLDPNLIQALDSSIKIRVLGGLNPDEKEKNNEERYKKRITYSKNELTQVIKVFEDIERQINPTWSKFEKAVFIYKTLCEYLEYGEPLNSNYHDDSRNLLGLINGRAVCAGIAMIFKEAMDRQGITCYYQNQYRSHAWNILEIDGEYYSVDLTWDVGKKVNRKCAFNYLGAQNTQDFYSEKYHNIDYEKDEKKFDLTVIPRDKINEAVYKTSRPAYVARKTNKIGNVEKINITINDQPYEIFIRNGIPYIAEQGNKSTFIRSDGTGFLLISTGNSRYDLNEYVIISYNQQNQAVQASRIFSEMTYDQITNPNVKADVANSLLSQRRVIEKVNGFNGYVGYIVNGQKYYREEIEQDLLNIHKR